MAQLLNDTKCSRQWLGMIYDKLGEGNQEMSVTSLHCKPAPGSHRFHLWNLPGASCQPPMSSVLSWTKFFTECVNSCLLCRQRSWRYKSEKHLKGKRKPTYFSHFSGSIEQSFKLQEGCRLGKTKKLFSLSTVDWPYWSSEELQFPNEKCRRNTFVNP